MVEKVKSHTGWRDVMEGRVRQIGRVGNEAADKAAKEALALAKLQAPATAFNAALAMAVLWAKWVMDYASVWDARWPDEAERAEEMLERDAGERGRLVRAERNTITHELWKGKHGTRCRRCGREATVSNPIPTFGSDACKGAATGRILASDTGNINYLWSEYRHSKEEMAIQGFALLRTRGIPRSAIDEGRIQEIGVGNDEGRVRTGSRRGNAAGLGGAVGREDEVAAIGLRGGSGTEEGGSGGMEEGGKGGGRSAEATPEDGRGRRHRLRVIGRLVWCEVCAAYSTQRAGARLRGSCKGMVGTRHRATRLERLRCGRHPLTNVALEGYG